MRITSYFRLITIILLITVCQSSFSQNIKGLYVNDFKNIIGNVTLEDELLQFAQDYNFNYLLLYNLHYIHNNIFDITNPTTAQPLADFIEKAKTQYGILEVGAVGEKFSSFNTIDAYQTSHSGNTNQQFDVYNIEFEFWNNNLVKPGKYYCTTYLDPNGYDCSKSGAFQYYQVQIEALDSLANIRGIISETYIGNTTSSQSNFIGETLDRVLVHFYRSSDVYSNGNSIYNYKKYRIEDLAPSTGVLTVLPIFSCRPSHMQTWLETNPILQAYTTFMDGQNGYNDDSGSWKNHINLDGFQWYRFTDMVDIPGLTYSGSQNMMTFESPTVIQNDFEKEVPEFETVSHLYENDSDKSRDLVYPNPAFSEINVPLNDLEVEKIILKDATGRVIRIMENSFYETEKIQINDLIQGNYFIEIHHETGISVERFIVVR